MWYHKKNNIKKYLEEKKLMNESQKLYLKRKADQLNSIINMTDPKITIDQKIAGVHGICEDMILLNLEDNPNVTSPIKQFFELDKKKAEQLISLAGQMNTIWDERMEFCKNFNNGIQEVLKELGLDAGFDFKTKTETPTEKPVETEIIKDAKVIEEEIDKKIDKS